MAEACATSEEAEEADFRDWATSNKISSKAVDMLVKDGFNSMDAIVLLEREDLSSKMPRGQQKLLLNALQSLRPQTTEEATDRGATADWAAAPVEACVSADIAGDSSRNVTAAPAATAAATAATAETAAATAATSQIGDVHQHPVGDVYTNRVAEHLRPLQTAAYDASRLLWLGHNQALSTPITRPRGLDCRISLRSGSQAATWWQDPQVYLASFIINLLFQLYSVSEAVAANVTLPLCSSFAVAAHQLLFLPCCAVVVVAAAVAAHMFYCYFRWPVELLSSLLLLLLLLT